MYTEAPCGREMSVDMSATKPAKRTIGDIVVSIYETESINYEIAARIRGALRSEYGKDAGGSVPNINDLATHLEFTHDTACDTRAVLEDIVKILGVSL